MIVLINRSDAIGDTILTMPMAKFIKDHYPEAKIYFIISPKSKDLFIKMKFVDGIFVLDQKDSIFKKVFSLIKFYRKVKPTHYFFVGGSPLPSYVAFLLGVKFRGGLVSKLASFIFLNKGVRQARSMVVMHEAEYNLNLLRPLGINYDFSMRKSFEENILTVTEEESALALGEFKDSLDAANLDPKRDYIFIHPGMVGHTLNWASRNYARFIIRMEKAFPEQFNYIISHTPGDEPHLIGLKDHLSQERYQEFKNVFYFDGSVKGLRHTMGVIKNANLYVGPSTGPTHIANALGVKTVAVYSPIKVQSAMRWGPINRSNKMTRLVSPDVVCGEQFQCAGEICPYFECMGKIEVEDVFEEAQSILQN